MTVAQRHSKILQKIRSHTKVNAELIAVSKLQPIDKIIALHRLGQRKFGENYAQELADKAKALEGLEIEWIFIGHIQSNKIRKIVSCANEIQTVASFSHAQQIARHAKDLGKVPYPIMLEVNAGEELSKSGQALDQIKPLADQIASELPELRVRGLMAIPPDIYSDAACSAVPLLYQELRTLADQIGDGLLSLGMSNDMRLALESGTNFVRVGTALFGSRP